MTWFVDNKRFDINYRGTPQRETPEPQVLTAGAIDNAIQSHGIDIYPSVGTSAPLASDSPSSPRESLSIRPSTPAGSPRASISGPHTPPGSPSPVLVQTSSSFSPRARPPSVGSGFQVQGSTSRQPSVGHRPRQGSVLNPQHERKISIEISVGKTFTGGLLPKNINLKDYIPGVITIKVKDIELLKKVL